MRDAIGHELNTMERAEGAHVLFACESGSRSWGYVSANADYDVRFVYVRPRDWYLQLQDVRDVIEWRLDETLDITGWDLAKFLRLMRKSNPSVFEWLYSTIVYREDPAFDAVRRLGVRSLQPKPMIYHYHHMAQSDWEHDLMRGDRVRLKSYLYATRGLYAAEWLLRTGKMGPQLIKDQLAIEPSEAVRQEVSRLLDLRRQTQETDFIARSPVLDAWIVKSLQSVEEEVQTLQKVDPLPWESYNQVFLELLA